MLSPTKTSLLLLLLLSLLLLKSTKSFPFYADLIPNGKAVPNPGPQGGVWAGVGHENAAGGGPRNPFGLDFKDAGFEWTQELCQKDSDGDGRTNGVELGDPECVWSASGSTPPAGPAVSHPGMVDQPKTTPTVQSCDDYEDPPDVKVLDIEFAVPNILNSTRTHYRCEQLIVEPPTRGVLDNYMVRSDVILSNPKVLHHIWIYHCPLGESSDGDRVGQGAYSCDGVEAQCQIVAGWAVGPESYCEPPNVAAYVDFRSSKVFKIEAHYDNSEGLSNVQDQSGMRLHLTPTPRPLDAGLVIVGMDYWDRQFNIPAKQDAHQLVNLCPTEATMMLKHPVWVYSWNPHMHLYGTQLVTEHWRCGEKIGEIGRIEQYEFDNQQSYSLDPPVKILPGDALVTTCTFDSSKVDVDIAGGEETTEEMCDNYLTYYPFVWDNAAPNLFTACLSYNEGLNPRYVNFDDTTPFASADLAGELLLYSWNPDPSKNIAPCCATNTCETDYRSTKGSPCGVTADCEADLVCNFGLCEEGVATPSPIAPSAPTASQPTASTPTTAPAPNSNLPSTSPNTITEAPTQPTSSGYRWSSWILVTTVAITAVASIIMAFKSA